MRPCPSGTKFRYRNEHGKKGDDVVKDRALATFRDLYQERITLKPSRLKYFKEKNEISFEIDPGIAFGTGTHPTTFLCMDMIERYLNRGDRVLDVGTGSGILMIAAAKMGAGVVNGIDKSSAAVEITRKNLILNQIEEKRYRVRTGTLLNGIEEQFDLIVANILMEIIVLLLDDVQKNLKRAGTFICSGMLEGNTHRVLNKMKDQGFEILETRTKERWVSIAGRRKK